MQTDAQRHAAAHNRRDALPDDVLLRLPQVLARVPVAKSTLWLWVREGRFPRPIKLGEMTTAWRATSVSEWIEAQARNTALRPIKIKRRAVEQLPPEQRACLPARQVEDSP